MKPRLIVCIVFLAFCVSGLTGSERGPVAVSPGLDGGVAIVGESCPTFSWTAVEWATGYRIEVFEVQSEEVLSYVDMTAIAYPVLSEDIQGRALSWTPSRDRRLSDGSVYVWYVQAKDAYGTAIWSVGKSFQVEVDDRLAGVVEKVSETLRDHEISDEVIGEILKDIGSEKVKTSGSGGYNTAAPIKLQGWDGRENTWYGEGAGFSLASGGWFNSFYGYQAGYKTDVGDTNVFIGNRAGLDNTSGGGNVFIGMYSGHHNISGHYNICIGQTSGQNNLSGFRNVFVGDSAGRLNETGEENVYLGTNAGYENTAGNNNVAIGYQAGYKNKGHVNVFLGSYAGYYETASNKLYIDNSNTTSPLIYGEFNNNIVAINGKLGVGTKSPEALLEIVNPSGRSDLVLNRNDGATFAFEAKLNNVRFGSLTAHRLKLIVGGNPKVTINTDGSLEMSSGATCTAAGVWTDASSRAYKENIQDLTVVEAKEVLTELNPVRFNYKKDKEEEYLGFIAEDVPDLVASKDRKGMSPMDVVAVLTKVVQEQQDTITELQERIAKLEKTDQ